MRALDSATIKYLTQRVIIRSLILSPAEDKGRICMAREYTLDKQPLALLVSNRARNFTKLTTRTIRRTARTGIFVHNGT